MMKRKLLAMDLDGTAVRDDYSLLSSSVDAIDRIRKLGCVTAFISGRRDIDMLTLYEEQWCVDYHILNNGGKIIRCHDRQIIANDCISREVSEKLIRFAFKNDLQLHIISGMRWQVTRMNDRTMAYARILGVIPETVTSLDRISLDDIEGFMATADLKPVAAYIDSDLPELVYVHSEPGTIDIMKNGVSKWNGIRKLAEILDIPVKDTIAVGNYYNDIDMIRHAGMGIAVANSPKEVKEAADHVTVNDNNNDAMSEIIDLMIKGAV